MAPRPTVPILRHLSRLPMALMQRVSNAPATKERSNLIKSGGMLAPTGAIGAGANDAPGQSGFKRSLPFYFVVVIPVILAGLYLAFLASDRYVSEARFIVRSVGAQGVGAMLGGTAGPSRAEDDTFAVLDFLISRDAIKALRKTIDLHEIYSHPTLDIIYDFPSIFYRNTQEDLFKYYKRMVSTRFDNSTGISTLEVQAFRPGDAERIAVRLLDLAEELINRINQRANRDGVQLAERTVVEAESRYADAQAALTTFRNREMLIDPRQNAIAVIDLIGKLSGELSAARAEIRSTIDASARSPRLSSLRIREHALEAQIAEERARTAASSDDLARKVADFERLSVSRETAKKLLESALSSLEMARVQAARQQLYLERIVQPSVPDWAEYPRKLYSLATIAIGLFLAYAIGWILLTGYAQHQINHRNLDSGQ